MPCEHYMLLVVRCFYVGVLLLFLLFHALLVESLTHFVHCCLKAQHMTLVFCRVTGEFLLMGRV